MLSTGPLRDGSIALLAMAVIGVSIAMLRAVRGGQPLRAARLGALMQVLLLAGFLMMRLPSDLMTWLQISIAFSTGIVLASFLAQAKHLRSQPETKP